MSYYTPEVVRMMVVREAMEAGGKLLIGFGLTDMPLPNDTVVSEVLKNGGIDGMFDMRYPAFSAYYSFVLDVTRAG